MITGLFLGPDVIAATGLFSPVVTVIGITYIIIIGIQILCSRAIGSGEHRKVVSLFSTGVVFLGICGIIFSASCLIFRAELIEFLLGGAKNITDSVTSSLDSYIYGYSYGITFQICTGMMMVFLPINNNTKLSYIAIIVMLVSNTLMDILSVVLNLGAFGLGLATSISYIVVFMLVFPSFMDKYKAIHFEWGNFCFSRLYEAAMLGLPSLMFTVGCTVKGYIMNMTLIHNIGSSAVAVMNVQGNICSTIGAVPLGCANAFLALGSLYYGEEDRKSLLYLTKYSLNAGIILSSVTMIVTMILIMSLSYYISDIFFNVNDEAFAISMRMLLLFPGFLVFNAIFSIFIKAYQLQGQTRLINNCLWVKIS